MKIAMKIGLMTILLAAVVIAAPAQLQTKPKVDYGKITGTWALQVDAGGEYYYLTLELKVTEGKLEGGLSEQNGMFTNSPLSNVEFDGQTLKFDVKIPTPPDGSERLVKTEAKLVENKLEGLLTIPDLQMSVSITGTKK